MGDPAKRVVVGVTASIAAYKAAELVRLIRTAGHEVTVVMTPDAARFVGEVTFRALSQRPVAMDMFNDGEEWGPRHISLADWCEVMLIAPCTAHMIAKLAHGLADDLVSCTALATAAPVIVAPAMNGKMWENPATRANVETLISRGIRVVDVGTGDLACGYQGKGRLAPLEDIMKALERELRERRA